MMQERLEAEERQRGRAQAADKRKTKLNLMRKKTKKGQPVMKHRIDSMLEQIQAGMWIYASHVDTPAVGYSSLAIISRQDGYAR